jgi:hypothetical protein
VKITYFPFPISFFSTHQDFNYTLRIKLKPEEDECTLLSHKWETSCSGCQLCQVVVEKNSLVIITAGFIILIS